MDSDVTQADGFMIHKAIIDLDNVISMRCGRHTGLVRVTLPSEAFDRLANYLAPSECRGFIGIQLLGRIKVECEK